MKDPEVRSKLERLRLTADTPEERTRIGRLIEIFEASPGDETPAEIVAYLGERGIYIDEDSRRLDA